RARVREALECDGLDAALVCGSEYTGFEGAVTYVSGFRIVHRYAYVLVPRDGEPAIVFPAEARFVGEHGDSQIAEQVFADRPGEWLAELLGGQRVGVSGLDYVMTTRDYVPLAAAAELVPWDVQFDLARAVKSEAELASVRESDEVQRMLEAYEEYYEVAQTALRAGATAHDVHRAVSAGFTQRGYHLGHVTGHSIGMTMIEHPRIGEGVETELAANMVFSMHP